MTAKIPLVTQLTNKVIRVLGCNPGIMTLQGTNTYVIGTGPKRILLDTGDACKKDYITNLTTVLKQNNIILDNIIITHWHHDHIGGLPDVYKVNQYEDCKIWKLKRKDEEENDLYEGIKINFLLDGQEIVTEGATLKMIHTPGHTTDHLSVLIKEDNTLFSGDCILGEGTAVFEDLSDYMKSLENILSLNPSVIFPGHGPVIDEPSDKIRYYISHRNSREAEIISVLNQADGKVLDEMDIVRKIYFDKPEQLQRIATNNVNHHLKKLKKESKVKQVSHGWQIMSSL